jgi:putative nucleotidyltransferase with HDIG domain
VKIVLIYTAVGSLWILASDRLLALFVTDPSAITGLQSYKGWFYVGITALLLYVLVRNDVRRLRAATTRLEESYEATLQGWVRALDIRDRETEHHTQRVTTLTVRLAERVGIPPEQLEHVRRGALLHDVGKIGIPDAILRKTGPLSDDEWIILRRHPALAYSLLSSIEYLEPAIDIPWAHHERWDGTGYPRGLAGEEIPFPARVFAVVDVWDALTSDRPYREAWPPGKVMDYIRTESGTHFDPKVADAFLEMQEEGRIA